MPTTSSAIGPAPQGRFFCATSMELPWAGPLRRIRPFSSSTGKGSGRSRPPLKTARFTRRPCGMAYSVSTRPPPIPEPMWTSKELPWWLLRPSTSSQWTRPEWGWTAPALSPPSLRRSPCPIIMTSGMGSTWAAIVTPPRIPITAISLFSRWTTPSAKSTNSPELSATSGTTPKVHSCFPATGSLRPIPQPVPRLPDRWHVCQGSVRGTGRACAVRVEL